MALVLGNIFPNVLPGTAADDVIVGLPGDDVLGAGGGKDTLFGGLGNDTYIVDNSDTLVGEAVIEGSLGGVDLVQSSVTYSLDKGSFNLPAITSLSDYQSLGFLGKAAYLALYGPVYVPLTLLTLTPQLIENLTLTGTGHIDGTGNGLDNVITGNDGDNKLYGLGGDDTFVASMGNDTIDGGAGDTDTADYSSVGGAITLNGTSDLTLTVVKPSGTDTLLDVEEVIADGTASNNKIDFSGASSPITINVDLSLNSILISGATDAQSLVTVVNFDDVTGGSGDDSITGDTQANNLFGGSGNDTVSGGDGDDNINGNMGDDLLYGDIGNDTVRGGQNNDTIYGGEGNDELHGDKGDDSVYGNEGSDTIYGGDGNDILYGNQDNDTLYGDAGNDTLYGGKNDDVLYGGGDNDSLYGDLGNDSVYGGEGNDTLYGGEGDDLISGGADKDILTGGSGSDLFDYTKLTDSRIGISWFNVNLSKVDVITDFTQGQDRFLVQSAPTNGFLSPAVRHLSVNSILGLGATVLGLATLGQYDAAQITVGSGSGARTFVAINNGSFGFNPNTDAFIELQNYTGGKLTINDFTTPTA